MNQQLYSANLFSRWSVHGLVFLFMCMTIIYLFEQSFQVQNHGLEWIPPVGCNNTDGASISFAKLQNVSQGDVQDNQPRVGPPKNGVVIVTQGRSGSTLLGNTIKLDHNVFYVYEPLHFLVRNKKLSYADGTKRIFTNYLDEAYKTVVNLLTCNITGLPFEFFEEWAISSNQGYQISSFYKTFKSLSELESVKKTPNVFGSKLLWLEKLCQNSSTVAIKTIRLPLFLAREMISMMEKLKIILLIRDPRPVISSQSSNFYKDKLVPSLLKMSHSVCTKLSLDVTTFNIMNCSYSSKLKLLMYETFVSDIHNETRILYEFLNLNFSSTVITGIQKMTTKGNRADTYTSYRNNSKQLVYLWRETIPFNVTQTIDSICTYAYSMAGYCVVKDESDLKNTTVPLYGDMCRNNITDGLICPTGTILP